jgi:hypothetical protein
MFNKHNALDRQPAKTLQAGRIKLRHWLEVLIVLTGAGFCVSGWVGMDFSDCKEGLPGAPDKIAAAALTNGADCVYGPSADESSYVLQRLTEMLYPVEYRSPVVLDDLHDGDFCVLWSRAASIDGDVLVDTGVLKLLRVKP